MNDAVRTDGVRTSPWDALRVTEEQPGDGTVRLRFAGELDLATGERLRAAAQGRGDLAEAARVEIDLRNVSFVDCAGMRAVTDVVRSVQDDGGSVVVTAGPAVARVARLIGTNDEVVFT